jgi:nucleotide-binding universal stress UspA family protein
MSGSGSQRWARPAVILVATDLGDLDRLMPIALEQAGETGARLILLHVLSAAGSFSSDAAGLPYYDTAGVLEFSERALAPWCEQARRCNVVCDALVREGNPTRQIADAACQFHADRVFLGTRSRGKLSKLLLGSVAEQVLRSVNLPVITVGPEAHLPAASGEERVVLHATTLGETSRSSAALASELAANRKAKLVLLHVLPPIDEMERKGLPTGLDSAAMHELRALAAETGAACGGAEPLLVHGNPSIEILATASVRHADLIVLGAAHRSTFENLARDHTVYRVLAHARCPVMTLREPLEQAEESRAESAAIHC